MRALTIFGLTTVLTAAAMHVASADDAEKGIAPSAEQAAPLAAGETVPAVTLQNANGEEVSLNALLAEQKTALIFYRGGWCPYCTRHLSEIAKMEDEIAAAGYQVIGINADSPTDVLKTVEKKTYPFTILSDSDLKAARAFGVAFKLDDATVEKYKGYGIKLEDSAGAPRYALPVPAFYLVDTSGKITFAHFDPDYAKRISKEDVLRAIQAK